MASQPQPSDFHPNGFHVLPLNPDGSLIRPTVPSSPATPYLTADSQLTLSKDIQLNPTTSTFLRLYRPVTPPDQKLPVIIYFHGGGFVHSSVSDAPVDLLCTGISAQIPAVVISAEYSLAPEHRLPAAYEDGVDAIMWVRDQAIQKSPCDEWLTEMADFSKVYLMGLSAGANLAYFAGLRVLDCDLDPITIVGLIIDQPFFGGVERTKSELRLVNDAILPLHFVDNLWSLVLPVGSDKDHEYCNPLGDQHRSSNGEQIKRLPMCLVRVNGEDPMMDRQKDFANMLEAHGVHVIRKFYEEGCHGAEFLDPTKAQNVYDDVKSFLVLKS